jgi:hypothetical protein
MLDKGEKKRGFIGPALAFSLRGAALPFWLCHCLGPEMFWIKLPKKLQKR